MHSGSHLKGAPSKRDQAKEERIYQEKKAPNKRRKKKRPRGKTVTREVLRTKKLSKYVKYY